MTLTVAICLGIASVVSGAVVGLLIRWRPAYPEEDE
jgi:hypothetical protein